MKQKLLQNFANYNLVAFLLSGSLLATWVAGEVSQFGSRQFVSSF